MAHSTPGDAGDHAIDGVNRERPPVDARVRESARSAQRTIDFEVAALKKLQRCLCEDDLGAAFGRTVDILDSARGRVVLTGIGKSGIIGRKISATLASTGIPSFFLHPSEASHGDLGQIVEGDIVIALSWSGETAELSDVVTFCSQFGIGLIAISSRLDSTLGRAATVCLQLPQVEEACPHGLAPTSSTVMQLAIGDALAVALIERRGFSPDRFKIFHPRGTLGARLVTLGDLMARGDAVPRVHADAMILQAVIEMSAKRFGITAVVDEAGTLVGVFSDGDLRRSLSCGSPNDRVGDHMTRSPHIADASMLGSTATALMTASGISQLFVCEVNELVGIVHLHDLLRA